jgi:hypothetical protein
MLTNRHRDAVRQTISRPRIMCGQVDHWLTPGIPHNSLHGSQRDRLVWTDAIDLVFNEGLLRVCRIASQEVVDIAIHDNHRDVPGCVSWGWHNDDCAVRGDKVAPIKGPEGLRLEDDRPGSEPVRPSVRQVTPLPPSEPLRKRQLLVRHEDFALGEVMQATRMIGVQMGKDNGSHIVGVNTELVQLRADLLFLGYVELDRQPEVRVPPRKVTRFTRPGSLSRVHQDDAVGRLNRPGIDREFFGPGAVEQDVELPKRASPPTDPLADFYPHGSSLDGVNLQRGFPRILFGVEVDLFPQATVDQGQRFDGFDLYEAYANIADSDELRFSDRYLTIGFFRDAARAGNIVLLSFE